MRCKVIAVTAIFLALCVGWYLQQQSTVNDISDSTPAVESAVAGPNPEIMNSADSANAQSESQLPPTQQNQGLVMPKLYRTSEVHVDQLLREYSNYRQGELHKVLKSSENKIKNRLWIEKANRGDLTEKEQVDLSAELKKQTAIRILLVQRQLEKIEAELL